MEDFTDSKVKKRKQRVQRLRIKKKLSHKELAHLRIESISQKHKKNKTLSTKTYRVRGRV